MTEKGINNYLIKEIDQNELLSNKNKMNESKFERI